MKLALLLVLVALVALACANPTPPPHDAGTGAGGMFGGLGGAGGALYPTCPQYRVEGIECDAPPDAGVGVLHKSGLRCALCSAVDSSGTPTAQPVSCTTVAGGDLCVADCNDCS